MMMEEKEAFYLQVQETLITFDFKEVDPLIAIVLNNISLVHFLQSQ